MELISAIVTGVVSLLVGGLGIWAGVKLVIDDSASFGYAVGTAFIGWLVWAIFGVFVLVPIIGPLLMLFIWIGVINWRYPGGWGTAAGIGLVAWIAAYALIYAISVIFDLYSLRAIGIPGV